MKTKWQTKTLSLEQLLSTSTNDMLSCWNYTLCLIKYMFLLEENGRITPEFNRGNCPNSTSKSAYTLAILFVPEWSYILNWYETCTFDFIQYDLQSCIWKWRWRQSYGNNWLNFYIGKTQVPKKLITLRITPQQSDSRHIIRLYYSKILLYNSTYDHTLNRLLSTNGRHSSTKDK